MRIVLVGGIAALGEEQIRKRLRRPHEIIRVSASEISDRLEAIRTADVIVGWPLTAELAANARKAKLIQAAGAGVDGLPFELLPAGVQVANTYHHETSIAEYIVMAMLAMLRRPSGYDARLREGNWWDSCIWGQAPRLAVLEGQRALFVGVGHIARETAKRTRAFGVRNAGVSRSPGRTPENFDRVVGYDTWKEELAEADFLVPCCPLSPATEGLIGAPEFERMKNSAYVINTARGRVIEERALYEALRDKRIAGAAIDVWYDYPEDPEERCPPSKHPFHELPNVLMTPHVSAWTQHTVEGRMRDIAENINRAAGGRPLINVVYVSPR